jgi:Na+-driven multidrug efflux pump
VLTLSLGFSPQSQEIIWPGVVANIASVVLDIIFNILFIHGTHYFGGHWRGWGYIGSPLGAC